MTCIIARYSSARASSISTPAPRFMTSKASFRLSGEAPSIAATACFAHSPGSLRTAAMMPSTLSCPKQRSIAGRSDASRDFPGSAPKRASTASTSAISVASASVSAANRACGTKYRAHPRYIASAAFARAPVSDRNRPILPGVRPRNRVAPTSGNDPMKTSGMAKTVVSEATQCEPLTERPAPPPMVMPWVSAIHGLRKRWMCRISWNSSRKSSVL